MNDRTDTAESASSPNGNREPVSALVDGEMDRGGAEFLLRRLADDESMHEHWQRCHLVRACLQHEFEGPVSLVGRVQAALENEALPERPARMSSLMRFGVGGAIAAGVALVAVTGLDYRLGQDGNSGAQLHERPDFVSQSTALDRQFNAEAVPTGFGARSSVESEREREIAGSQQRINRYMIRHSQAAGGTGFNSLAPVLAAPATVRLASPAASGGTAEQADEKP